jgi:hypothetical protein
MRDRLSIDVCELIRTLREEAVGICTAGVGEEARDGSTPAETGPMMKSPVPAPA